MHMPMPDSTGSIVDEHVSNQRNVRHADEQLSQFFDANVLRYNEFHGNDILHSPQPRLSTRWLGCPALQASTRGHASF